jgi:signal transduction histidine kinase
MAELRIITGPLRGTRFELEKGGWAKSIGRIDGMDIVLADKAISRKHAEVFYRDSQWFIRDLGSSNGTFINEQRITEPIPLKNNDQIRCGATVLLFESDQDSWILDKPAKDSPTIELEYNPGDTMVAIAFDNLQTKQSAQQRQRLMQAGQAALNLSHGIKNILQAVSTGRDVIDSAFSRNEIDQAKKGWNILKRNLEQIQKLVLDMLKFSKEIELRLQPCLFNRLIETVIQMVSPQAQMRSVTVAAQLDEQIGMVNVDPDRMQDVIMNLLLNAIEAVEPQKGQVTVSTELDTERHQMILRVADNGPGINDLSSLFEPFHTTKGNTGVGLGLAIVRKVVLHHKGTVDAQSIPGEGSIFTVRLPYLPVNNEVTESPLQSQAN